MTQQSEIPSRLNELRLALKDEISRILKLARRNYHFAYILMTLTIVCSLVAGVGGLFLPMSKEAVGGLALLPGAFALVATVLKPQARANWHYRKYDELNGLFRRALFDLPESPSASDVADISRAWTKLDKDMRAEFENELALDWSPFQNGGRPGKSKDPT